MMDKYSGKYDDIINLPHHVSPKRSRMGMIERAAQFSPFAALTGYDAAVDERARLTDEEIEFDEGQISVINDRLNYVLEHLSEHPQVKLVYFRPDERKDGGSYPTKIGKVKKMDMYNKTLIFEDGTVIEFERIAELDINT